MTTLTHQQFNSPMALYSKENVDDVYQKSLAALTPKHPSSHGTTQSETYRLLHNKESLPPQHSVRYEEPSRDYPHYQGFVDPNLQSPSFRRLQYMTGLTPETEQSEVLSGTTVTVHQDNAASRMKASGVGQQYAAQEGSVPYSATYGGAPPPPPPHMPTSNAFEQKKHEEHQQQLQQHTSVFSYEPAVSDDAHDQQMSESLARKLAEAERPKVPPTPVPYWARTAQQKRAQWEGRQEQQQEFSSSTSRPPIEARYFAPIPTAPSRAETLPRPASVTPTSYQQRQYQYIEKPPRSSGSESWLKVCMAPNLEQLDNRPKYSTWRQSAYRPMPPAADTTTFRKQVDISSLVSGQAEKPVAPVVTIPPWHQAAQSKHSKWQQQMDRLDPNVQPKAAAAPPQPSWTRRAEQKQYTWQRQGDTLDPYSNRPRPAGEQPPSWAKRAEKTQTLWRTEADAWNERKKQETAQRTTDDGHQPPWRQRPPQYDTAKPQTDAVGQARAKTFSSGSFYDEQGQKVDFRREVYATVQPGAEYSVCKESEESTIEKPAEPGAPIKRTIQKYYKKSTMTSTTTTRSAPMEPIMSNAQMPLSYYPTAGIQPGAISAHESQF